MFDLIIAFPLIMIGFVVLGVLAKVFGPYILDYLNE